LFAPRQEIADVSAEARRHRLLAETLREHITAAHNVVINAIGPARRLQSMPAMS
jgi:hypothetical protein